MTNLDKIHEAMLSNQNRLSIKSPYSVIYYLQKRTHAGVFGYENIVNDNTVNITLTGFDVGPYLDEVPSESNLPVDPGSVKIFLDGDEVGKDDSLGTINGDTLDVGSYIVYDTGIVEVNFITALGATEVVTMTYDKIIGEAKKGIIIWTPEVSLLESVGIYYEEKLPILGYFDQADNVERGDVITSNITVPEGVVSRKLEVVDIKATGRSNVNRLIYVLAPISGASEGHA